MGLARFLPSRVRDLIDPYGDLWAVNPKAYGAVGDGVTDDTAALQAAATAAAGHSLLIDATYLISDAISLPSNIAVRAARGGTIKCGTTLASGGANKGRRLLELYNVSDVTITGLTLDTTALNSAAGSVAAIRCMGATRFVIRDNIIKTCGAATVATAGAVTADTNAAPCSRYWIVDNDITVTLDAGLAGVFQGDGVIDQWWGCHDFTIRGNIVRCAGAGQYAILVTGTSTDFTAYGGGGIFATSVYSIHITDNKIYDPTITGVWVMGRSGKAHDVFVVGNLINNVRDKAKVVLTEGATPFADGDTVTINNRTYRIKTTMSQANDVKRGGTGDATLDNIVKAVNQTGVSGTDYFAGTTAPTDVTAAARSGTGATATVTFTAGTLGARYASTTATATDSGFAAATFLDTGNFAIGLSDIFNFVCRGNQIHTCAQCGVRAFSENIGLYGDNGAVGGIISNNVIELANSSGSSSNDLGSAISIRDSSNLIGVHQNMIYGSGRLYRYAIRIDTAPVNIRVTGFDYIAGTQGTFSNGSTSSTNTLPGVLTYSPTLTNQANVASSAASGVQYRREGDYVTVYGQVTITPTAGAPTDTKLGISLPIASNIGATSDCPGSGCDGFGVPARIFGDAANDVAVLEYPAPNTSARNFGFTFQYKIQ